MCRIRWPASLALLLVLLLAPAPAMADETDVLGGFGRGFETLVSPESVSVPENNPQLDYIEEYDGTRALESGNETRATVIQGREYQSVVNTFNQIQWSGTRRTWLQSIQALFVNYNTTPIAAIIVPTAAALCFLWWGVRKVLKMVNSSYKKSRLGV